MKSKMQSKAIREWLASYKALPPDGLHDYAKTVCNNTEVIDNLLKLFESQTSTEVLDPVCHQLFEFYRSEEEDLLRFSLDFVPILTWLYLETLARNEKKTCSGVEAYLLGIYNLEIVHQDGKPKISSFRIPSIAQPSVYHEPLTISSMALTEGTLSRYSKNEEEIWRSGPHPQYESINAQNRHEILTYVVQCYNREIALLSAKSHRSLCKAWSRIAISGFGNLSNLDMRTGSEPTSPTCNGHVLEPRLSVSQSLLIEMLSGLYYVMFNGFPKLGIQTLEEIHNRASYELFPDVQLVSNAIRNSLKFNPSGQPGDGPMGIAVALSPTTSSTSLSKSAITNASFRAKKLPEDITVPDEELKSNKHLPSIEEGAEGSMGRSPGQTRHSGKHSKTGKKSEKTRTSRSKEKDKDREDSGSISSVGKFPASASMNGDSSDGGSLAGSVRVAVVRQQGNTIVDTVELQNLPAGGVMRKPDSSPVQRSPSLTGPKKVPSSVSVDSISKKSSSSSLSNKLRAESITAPLASLSDTEDSSLGKPRHSSSSNHIAISRSKDSCATTVSANRLSGSSVKSIGTDV